MAHTTIYSDTNFHPTSWQVGVISAVRSYIEAEPTGEVHCVWPLYGRIGVSTAIAAALAYFCGSVAVVAQGRRLAGIDKKAIVKARKEYGQIEVDNVVALVSGRSSGYPRHTSLARTGTLSTVGL